MARASKCVRRRVKAVRHGKWSTFGLANFGLKKSSWERYTHKRISQDEDNTLRMTLALTLTHTLTLNSPDFLNLQVQVTRDKGKGTMCWVRSTMCWVR